MQLAPSPVEPPSAGEAWVQRFLLPLLNCRLPAQTSLRCLQLWPDDETEARALEASGHRCQMIEPASLARLGIDSEVFDFVFTGRFSSRATSHDSRVSLAQEIARILCPGGAFLTVLGNRYCPIDLTRNGPFIHGPGAATALSVKEARKLFLRADGFDNMDLVSPAGHFAWRRAPALRPAGGVLEAFWKMAATPSRKWLLESPLNPTLILWLTRK